MTALAAVDVKVIGPVELVRAKGQPTVHQEGFPAAEGPGVLLIRSHGVSSALVRLNGADVVSPEAFNPGIDSFNAPVHLLQRNQLEVELRGKPGSRLWIEVNQTLDVDGATVVSPAGGVVRVEDPESSIYGASLVVPAGALGEAELITMTAAPDAPPFSDGLPGLSAVDLGPSGLAFDVPASLTLPYRPAEIDSDLSLGEDTLSLYDFDEAAGLWVGLPTETVDTIRNLVTSSAISHLSFKAVRPDLLHMACRVADTSPYLPVLLVHGLQILGGRGFCSWGAGDGWGQLPALLESKGGTVCQMNYNTERDIAKSAEVLRRAVEKLVEFGTSPTGERPGGVTVIAHSMGGLVARYAVEKLPRDPELIRQVVTLATPHLGSDVASLAFACTSGRQMLPGSTFLEGPSGLNTSIRPPGTVPDLPACETDYYLYAGSNDWVVAEESALAADWTLLDDPPRVIQQAFEPPAIETVRRLKSVVEGCGPGGQGGCDHTNLFHRGIAAVHDADHVMWERAPGGGIKGIVETEPWFSGSKSCEVPGLIAHYPLDRTGENVAGPGFQGRLVNNPQPVPDRLGRPDQALRFTRALDQWIEVSESWFDSSTGPLTLSAWVHIRSLASDGEWIVASLLGKGTYLWYFPEQRSFAFGLRNGMAITYDYITAPVSAPGWHLVTGVWHGTADGTLELYVDGVKRNQTTLHYVLNENPYTSGIGGNGYHRGRFDGELDDIRIYRRALTPADIAQLYQAR
jgi:pimeloyl-ACP methyl ester carboxylesterase